MVPPEVEQEPQDFGVDRLDAKLGQLERERMPHVPPPVLCDPPSQVDPPLVPPAQLPTLRPLRSRSTLEVAQALAEVQSMPQREHQTMGGCQPPLLGGQQQAD